MCTNACIACFVAILSILAVNVRPVHGWVDADDLELYDLVEEVKQNFYTLLELNETATTAEVKRSFRVLSLKYHPDKNKEADAEVKFRNLVSVAEVLKNETKRKKYDHILVNGLPDWRSGVYYYRRVRKLSLLEMSIILSILLTFGHYLCLLASFWEKNYEISELLKKKQKKFSKEQLEEIKLNILESMGLSTPRLLYDNLIVKLSKFSYKLIIYEFPQLAITYFELLKENLRKTELKEEIVNEEISRPKRTKPKAVELPNFDDLYAKIESEILKKKETEIFESNAESLPQSSSKKEWTEADLHQLIKLTKKFPGGIPQRWERIACTMGRDVDDVTQKAKEVKSGAVKCSTANNEFVAVKNVVEQQPSIASTETVSENIWSQEQQRLFEIALKKFPKGTEERWENITAMVPGKTKEECILRFKSLVEYVKQKRQTT